MRSAGQLALIDETLIADERDPSSPGMRLARELGVTLAPFFVVETGGDTVVYTVYLKFVREVLNDNGAVAPSSEEAADILRSNPDLDLI